MISESAAARFDATQKNKKLVADFFDMAFVEKKIQEAFDT